MLLKIVGVDPGFVHTGLVGVSFDTETRTISRRCKVVESLDMPAVAEWIEEQEPDLAVVEQYNPRGSLSTNATMVAAERELKVLHPRIVSLDNTGITKVVTPGVLQVLGLWDFPLRTHHQDLRSAARILVKAMMQDQRGNTVLADAVRASLDGEPWTIGDWGC